LPPSGVHQEALGDFDPIHIVQGVQEFKEFKEFKEFEEFRAVEGTQAEFSSGNQ